MEVMGKLISVLRPGEDVENVIRALEEIAGSRHFLATTNLPQYFDTSTNKNRYGGPLTGFDDPAHVKAGFNAPSGAFGRRVI